MEAGLQLALRNVTNNEYEDLAVRSISNPTRVGFYPAPKRVWEVGAMLTLRR